MGYRSNGSGIFKLRNPDKKEDAIKMLDKIAAEESNFESLISEGGDFQIDFSDWKIYIAGDAFKKIMELFNGFFEIRGEDPEDISRLVFRDGISFSQDATLTFNWQAEEETDLSGKQWN